ncbi:hypothetical protein [Parachlamydia sp. AcF125]|uniref:hypothetical protein n=1 Tax=Parachlamydia sp. AcF125 TaxID=2795736 RepID=UPI001BC986DD|nr:hypothetical protein [Parachlamydia sp. AcF125]MBS4167417.1 hypothetical protein [Parachlamydia sp. AcF125]
MNPIIPSSHSSTPPFSLKKAEARQTATAVKLAKEALPNNPSLSPTQRQSRALSPSTIQRDVTSLLKNKLENPHFALNEQESLAVLMEGIRCGQNVASQAVNKDIVAIIGLAGAGKSTLVNDLCGCDLLSKRPRELGFSALSNVVEVKPQYQGGKRDEVVPIRHRSSPQVNFLPQFATNEGHFYCDFPGFLDCDSYEIGTAKSVTLQTILNAAKSLKVIILTSYSSLVADRARKFTELLEICIDLFGSKEKLLKNASSILVGVTQVPSGEIESLEDLKAYISKMPDPIERKICSQLAQRLFIYDPLNNSHLKDAGAGPGEEIKRQIDRLPSIEHSSEFKAALSPSDLLGLDELLGFFKKKVDEIIAQPELLDQDFKQLAVYHASLRPLCFLENRHVSMQLENLQESLLTKFRHLLWEYSRLYEAGEVRSFQILKTINAGLCHFDSATKERLLQLIDEELHSSSKGGQPSQPLRTASLEYVKRTQRLMDMVLAANTEIERLGGILFTNVQQFATQTYQLSQSLHSLVHKVEQELKEVGLSAARIAQVHCLIHFAQFSRQIIQDTSWQCLSLEKKGAMAIWSEFKGALELALYARRQEIDQLAQQWELIAKQDDHDWAILMKVHAGKLRQETQLYNQLLQVEELKRQTNIAAMSREIAALQQRNIEIQAMQELSREEQEIYYKHQQKIHCLELGQPDQRIRFDVQARCQLAELLTFQLNKGGNHDTYTK